MNTSQTKIRKIQEANRIAEERFLMSEQSVGQPTNPVASQIKQPDPIKNTVSKKLPTDFNKNIMFLFPDQTSVILTPKKQDISKLIIKKLGLGEAPQGNVFNLIKTNGAKKVCGKSAFTSQVYIFTEPNSFIDDVCNVDNISPDFLSKIGAFVVPNKPEFVKIGKWAYQSETTPKE